MTIVKRVDFGLYLDGKELGEILMPKRYASSTMEIGDEIDVMVYLDGEERYLATTEEPLGQVGEVAFLKVNKVENVGAFLDWGLSKELMVPFSEQKVKMQEGRYYVVYIYVDTLTDRITGSMKLEKHLHNENPSYAIGEEINLMIWTKTEIGYKVIINNKHLGILYKDEIFKRINTGDIGKGFIKKQREDGKIDVSLERAGYKKIDAKADKIMSLLEKSGGFLPYNDKTNPEVIYNIFGVSKKVFKQSLGNLFKQRLIEINEKGIQLTNNVD